MAKTMEINHITTPTINPTTTPLLSPPLPYRISQTKPPKKKRAKVTNGAEIPLNE